MKPSGSLARRRLPTALICCGFGPTTIAAIYKDRWEIELFFKALKQNLKVKSFVGTSRNALQIQIWTALIAMLLLKWLHHLSKAKWSFSNLACMPCLNLFTYRDLQRWQIGRAHV